MDPRIADLITRMEQAFDQPLRVEQLAAAVNLSPSRLAHLFTRETGTAPARYLHQLRMQRARLLLERTFLSVKQVMARVGINDPSHFSRDFRRFHGVPPSALRQHSSIADAGRAGGLRPPSAAGGQVGLRQAADNGEPTANPAGEKDS